MKKILFWIALIGGIVALIGSCAEKDDSTTSTTSTTTLSAPSGVSATLGYYQVPVEWTAVSGASSYTVYWGSSTGITSSSTAITGITDDNYTHTGLDNGTKYYYKVATVNSAGTGLLSDEKSATPRDAPTVTEACIGKETASGTVQGVKGTGPSGTFYHTFYGAAPSNGCINADNITTVFSTVVPSVGVNSIKHALVITGDGYGFTDTWHYYSDTACAVETGFFSQAFNNLATSDNITIASPKSGYPGEATKVIFKDSSFCLLAETDTLETKLESWLSASLTKGTVDNITGDLDNKTTIWTVLDNISGQTINWFYSEDPWDNNTYPSNFSDSTTWHAGDNITR